MFRSLNTLVITIVLSLGQVGCTLTPKTPLPDGVTLIESHQLEKGELGIAYEKYRLPNGLTVLLHPDHSDPLVHVNVTYHVGSAREEPGKSGFAHFFEHMMFEGSVHAPDDLHTQLVDAMGGSMNGGTDSDLTRYYNTVPASELEKMLWLEADRMAYVLPEVTQQKFEIQRATVKNERAQRYDNAPYGLMWETASRALYQPEFPYAWPVIGYIEDLNRVGVDDLKAFFMRWYGPNNATLVVAGDFDKTQALQWVARYFAAIPAGPEVKAAPKQLVKLEKERYVTLEDPLIQLPLVQISYPTVYAHHQDEAPLDFLSQIIGDGKNSLLYQKLVKTGLAVQVGASHPCRELACSFNIYALANPASGKSLSDIETVIRTTLDEWAEQASRDPQLAEHLKKFQSMFKASSIYGLETVRDKASQLASNQSFFDNPDMVEYDLNRYGAVTPQDVQRVYQEYLQQGSVTLSVVPKGAAQIAAKEQNYELPDPLQPKALQTKHIEVKPLVLGDGVDRFIQPETGPAVATHIPESWDFELANGIQVKGATTSEIPAVSLLISIEGGSLIEPIEKAGVASLTAKMMMEATQLHSAEELSDQLDRLGSQIQFSAGGRSTQIVVSSLVENLPQTLSLLQEMLFKPGFNAEDFTRIQQHTLQFLQQAQSDPQSIANRAQLKLLWGENNRLGISGSGTLESVSKLTLDDVKRYYKENYSAAMASVVVVGNVSPELARQSLAQLASWQGKPVQLPEATQGRTDHLGQILLVDQPGAAQAVMTVARPALPFDATGTFFKLNLVNQPLGGNFTSRANLLLREEKGYTYGAFSGFAGGKQQGRFTLSANLLQDKTYEAVEDTIELMQNYAHNGVTNKELAELRTSVTQREALKYESIGQKASLLSRMQAHDLDDNFVERRQQIIRSITVNELNELASEWLDPQKMWILVVADASKVEEKLKQIKGWHLQKLSL